jgi:type III secretion protein N (ATPase)
VSAPDLEPALVELGDALKALDQVNPRRLAGRVTEVTGLVVRATIPGVRVGELVYIDRDATSGPGLVEQPRLQAEVVGFRGDEVVLIPLGEVAGIGPDAVVSPTGRPLCVRIGQGILGRVLNGLGDPVDGQGPIAGETEEWAVDRPAPDPLTRQRVTKPLALGVRAIDAFLTVGEGQRVGLFSGSGVGKSMLLGQIARQTEADVNVIAIVGERGREVTEFIEDALGPEGRARSVVVCATSDAPSLVRLKSWPPRWPSGSATVASGCCS